MRSVPEIIESIRAALAELDGHPEADHVLAVLWRDLANRRPAVMGFGKPCKVVPTEAVAKKLTGDDGGV